MNTTSARPLLRPSSSPKGKHTPDLRFFREIPNRESKDKPPNHSFPSFGGNTGQPAYREQCGNMASQFAHDLVNILTAIQGNAELTAVHLSRDSSLHRYLQNIQLASSRGHELLEHLLSGMPHRQFFHEEMDLRLLVDEVLEVFRTTLSSAITLEKIDRLPNSRMLGNPTQIFRMLSNLLSNATRSMHSQPEGTLSIILDKVEETDPRPFPTRSTIAYLKLQIQDTGSGMSADLCERIFSPYFTTNQDGKGIGLGLAIVKEVVTDHDGVVTVESELGRGSTFTVFFPVYSESEP